MSIHIVGGFYREYCTRPAWDQVYGSGGRAAAAIATFGADAVFHTYVSPQYKSYLDAVANAHSFKTISEPIAKTICFEYLHDLARPNILGKPDSSGPLLNVDAHCVLRFGMLEGDAVVRAQWAVHDPQNQGDPQPFSANGSHAEHLALVLNLWEAQQLASMQGASADQCAQKIAHDHQAEVVVIKQGARGAVVYTNGNTFSVPAYRTSNVWKIGSGDCFAAYFALAWMDLKHSPVEAANFASKATAFYCETKGFATQEALDQFQCPAITCNDHPGEKSLKTVYLAGPFFHLAQIWMIEEARTYLQSAGLKVFSPFHDVGLGSASDVVQKDVDAIHSCDLMFAIADGLDPGTIFEVGYARSIGKPVVIYSEVEVGAESLKMMEGTGCEIYPSFTSGVYATRWKAAEL